MGFFYFYPMDVRQYLDSTYLKTAEQADLSEDDNSSVVKSYIEEAIKEQFKLIMIRPEYVSMAKKMIEESSSALAVGTVIDFPNGTSSIDDKLNQAQQAINSGADELDFVCNYQAFIDGNIGLVKNEILKGTALGLENFKVVKWIIETAALNPQQIVQISALIKNVVLTNFKESQMNSVFVKSSTGFYKTEDGRPNGATIPNIILMLENAAPLPVKAAGGVRNYNEAIEMINLGVKRIGTSAAKAIADGKMSDSHY